MKVVFQASDHDPFTKIGIIGCFELFLTNIYTLFDQIVHIITGLINGHRKGGGELTVAYLQGNFEYLLGWPKTKNVF